MTNLSYPRACWCTGACSHAVTGTGGTVVPNANYIGDVIGGEIIRNGGLETNFIYKDPFSLGVAGLLFDVKTETYPDGTTAMVYRLKGGLGTSSRMKPVAISKRNGECVVVWYEGTALNTSTTLVADAVAGATTLTLTDATAIGGIATPMTLIIKDEVNGNRVTVNVTAVDPGNPNLVTISPALAVDVSATSCVMRGHYNPAAGCTNSYSNSVSYYNNDKEYFSYFTRIIHTLEYNNKCVINQTYLSDLLNGSSDMKETAAYRILQSNFSMQIDEAFKQLMRSVFFHKNVPSTATTYSETYGLLAKLKEVHMAGVPQFFDLSECCDPAECDAVNAENIINTFLDIVMSRAQLSIYSETKRVVVAINSDFLGSLMKMRKYFEQFSGEVRTVSVTGMASEGDVISTRRKSFVLEDRGYEIYFVLEPAFDEIPGEFGLIMPENAMWIFTWKYDHVELTDGGVKLIEDNTNLTAGDTLKFKMWKDERTNSVVDGCTSWVMRLEYCIIHMFVDKCAYAGIMNIGSCFDKADCHDCTVSQADVPFIG